MSRDKSDLPRDKSDLSDPTQGLKADGSRERGDGTEYVNGIKKGPGMIVVPSSPTKRCVGRYLRYLLIAYDYLGPVFVLVSYILADSRYVCV